MQFYEGLEDAFKHLSKNGAFLTVKDEEGTVNTMTISWGYVGFSWGGPYFVAMVRPQRYTHDVLDKGATSFTVSIPYESDMRKALAICGSQSGRDINKEEVAEISFVPAQEVDSPVVDNCDKYYECKISYIDKLHVEILPQELQDKWYKGDYHDLYYGEIVTTYGRDSE